MAEVGGFASKRKLMEHFWDHGAACGAASEWEYVCKAVKFMHGPLDAGMHECTRAKTRDRLRYSETTEEFGVVRQDGILRSYFIADPVDHQWPSNLEYFWQECSKL